jgi:lactate dehydrogenase-like 2-hydroxyacid dehydrogenase
MKIVLLDAKTLGEDLDLSIFEKFGTFISYETTSAKKTMRRIEDADIVLTNKVVITQEMMERASRLKLICITATGMNNVDLKSAKSLGIAVKNVAGYSTKSVVQHTFAMALYLLEQLSYYDNAVKSGKWTQSKLFTDVSRPFFEISGKRWGIIGLGAIGQEVARVAEAFGAEVSYYSTSGSNLHHAYPHRPLEFILRDSDIISIHAPLNEDTMSLIDERNLHLIKEGAILLNLGRGGIINETDLLFELNRRRFYAGLDVLEQEPLSPTSLFHRIKDPTQLLITPHIAWTSIEARKKLLKGVAKNIKSFLKNHQKS